MSEISVRRFSQGSGLSNSLIDQILHIHESVVIARSDVPPANGFLMGIGTALVNAAKGYHPNGLVADVLVEPVRNDASLSFFAKHEFQTIGELHLAQYRDFGKLISSVLLWRAPP